MKVKRLTNRLSLIFAIAFGFSIAASPIFADDDKAEDDKEAVEEGEAEDKPEEAEAEDEGGVIPAEKIELVRKKLKQAVIVHGTIGEVKIYSTSGNALLKFEESDLGVFVRKADIDKHKGWDLKKLEGLGVYVAGQVKIYRDQLEVVIVGPDQIAATPDGFDLAKIPMPETSGKSGSTSKKTAKKVPGAIAPSKKDYPDLPLKLETASVQTVAFYLKDTGMKMRDDPYGLPADKLVATVVPVTATVTKAEGGGPMQVAFPKPEEDSKDHIQAVLDQLAEIYGKWPEDKLVTIDVDFDSREFKDDPASLVIASLIHSLVTGKEIASNVIISADVDSEGNLGVARANVDGDVPSYDLLKAISENVGEPVRLVSSDVSTDELNDLALDGEWETLAKVAVLAAPDLKEALRLIFAEEGSELAQGLTAFDQVQAVIKSKGYALVKNSQVQQRVMVAGKAWPTNKSAAFYAYYGRGKVPRTYSLPYTHHKLSDIHTQLRFLQISKAADPKEKFRAFADQLKEMRSKLNPDLSKLVRALSDFEGEASDAVLKPRDGRAGERQEEKLKEADGSVVQGLADLMTLIEGGEVEEE